MAEAAQGPPLPATPVTAEATESSAPGAADTVAEPTAADVDAADAVAPAADGLAADTVADVGESPADTGGARLGDPGGAGPVVVPAPDPVQELAAPVGSPVRLDFRSAVWIGGGLFIGLVLLAFFRNVPSSLTRIGVGVLLAFALDPLVGRLRHRFGWSRARAVGIVGGALVALFAVLLLVLGPPAIRQARDFGEELPRTVEGLYDLPVVGGWLERNDAAGRIDRWADELPDRIDAENLEHAARTLLDGVVAGVIVVLVAVAVLLDGDRLIRRIQAALPASFEPAATRVGRTFYRTVGAYFSGSLLVASLAATFVLTVGLAFGVPLAPAAALWMLAVNLIPQIGGFLGGAFLGLLAFSQGAGTGVIVVLLYILWNTFENHVITPAIVGGALDLSPPATMLAALIGGAALGVPGALVATPLVGAIKSLYLELRYGRTVELRRSHGGLGRFRATVARKLRNLRKVRKRAPSAQHGDGVGGA